MIQEVVEQVENIVRDVINNSVHTAMPGIVLSYDAGSGLADVQPVGSYYCGKVEMDYPVVPAVPVCITASNTSDIAVCVPVKEGDTCLLICAEQSLSAFLTDTSDRQSNEMFELTNCIAIPGLQKTPLEAQQEANEKQALILVNKDNKIAVLEDKIEITGDVEIKGDVGIAAKSGKVSITGDLFVNGSIRAAGSIEGG